jgi:predicted nucleotidyltransferase
MTNLIQAVKDVLAGNYPVDTTPSGAVESVPFRVGYTPDAIAKVMDAGATPAPGAQPA